MVKVALDQLFQLIRKVTVFRIGLDYIPGNEIPYHDASQDFECLEDLVMEICDNLSEDKEVIFKVQGFGMRWPLDIRTDLSVIVPQLKNTINIRRITGYSSLDFYEQGIERKLEFSTQQRTIIASCRDLINGQEIGNTERFSVFYFENMMINFLRCFIECVRLKLPALSQSHFFTDLLLFSQAVQGRT